MRIVGGSFLFILGVPWGRVNGTAQASSGAVALSLAGNLAT